MSKKLLRLIKMEDHSNRSDQELVTALKGGDVGAFDEIYNRNWHILYGIAYNRLRNTQSAEDVVHDVLVSLWKNRDTAEIDKLSAYLATATRYMIFNVIKRARKFSVDLHHLEQAEEIIDAEDIEARLHYKRILDLVNQEVDKLPEKCRLIFRYSRDEQLSVKEIAEKMKISPSTVENQINKALKTLKKKVTNIHLILF